MYYILWLDISTPETKPKLQYHTTAQSQRKCLKWGCMLLARVDPCFWLWSGVEVSALASINEVNLRRARLVLRWATVSGFNSRCRTFRYVTNQPPKVNSAFYASGVGKWVPASAGTAKPGMVHSVSGWTRGVQVKLWDTLRTRAIPEHLRGVFTTRRYTNTFTRADTVYLNTSDVCSSAFHPLTHAVDISVIKYSFIQISYVEWSTF